MDCHTYHVIGLMSGSSLDGTDITWCSFDINAEDRSLISWQLHAAETIPYASEWITRIKALPQGVAAELVQADADLGHYYGKAINQFLIRYKVAQVDLVASHGHTIFHFPESKATCQIGDGAAIAAITGIDTVTQLRSMDVALGGQGAPIAPLGDRYMYKGYDVYLNLGGIANLSTKKKDQTIAFDLCACNQLLNGLANQVHLDFDDRGMLAARGKVNIELLEMLNRDPYLQKKFPKSLDNTYVLSKVTKPAISFDCPMEDKLNTAVEFISSEIHKCINVIHPQQKGLQLLISGGGALNDFLIKRLKEKLPGHEFHFPTGMNVEFKEAAFIAFAGLCRVMGRPNLFADVTGASADTINGAVYCKQKSVFDK